MRVREAARVAKADDTIPTINATNLNAYMDRFATMLNWAVSEEYLGRNPARGLQLAETVHPQDRRKPFELWQLQRIFNMRSPLAIPHAAGGFSQSRDRAEIP